MKIFTVENVAELNILCVVVAENESNALNLVDLALHELPLEAEEIGDTYHVEDIGIAHDTQCERIVSFSIEPNE